MARWHMHLEEQAWRGSRQLFLVKTDGARHVGREQRRVLVNLVFKDIDAGMAMDQLSPLAEHREEREDDIGDVTNFLQAALDCAWQAGMRPKDWEDNRAELNGELTATKAHLQDMRKMAKVPGA